MKIKNNTILWSIFIGTIFYFFFVLGGINGDSINFGIGLGALAFYYLAILSIVILFIMSFIILKIKNEKTKQIVLIITVLLSLIICLIITYYFTLGRGPNVPWNGKIFNPMR